MAGGPALSRLGPLLSVISFITNFMASGGGPTG